MSISYAITELKFSGGTSVSLSSDDIVVFVGPNNAGKSAALIEIVMRTDAQNFDDGRCHVVTGMSFKVSQETEQLKNFLQQLEQVPGADPQVARMGNTTTVQSILQNTENPDYLRRGLRAFCMYMVTTEPRLQITKQADLIDFESQRKSHPFHYLYDDAKLETDLSDAFFKAFGTDLVVDRMAGSVVFLRVGARPPSGTPYNFDEAYRVSLRKLPLLHAQGDGMRAFVGSLMWAYVVDYHIVLIDEPEAFLHPPQAKVLGRTIAKRKKDDRQLFFATHSGEFLRGVLEANPKSLRVLRIVREGNINYTSELKPAEIKELWSDPLLRQTNTLDALFHSLAVLCEADGDCQFYSVVQNVLSESAPDRKPLDAMFIHCGGKYRMPKVVAALRAVGVPIKVVADFDVLREETPLRTIYEALGGVWETIRKDWKTVTDAVTAQKAQLDLDDLKKAIDEALAKVSGTLVPDQLLEDIRSHTRKASAWSYAKTVGESFIPKGAAHIAYQELKQALADKGLFIVPVGELESFCKSVSYHGPAWVSEVCKRNLATDPELKLAREFVEKIFWSK